MKKGNKFCKHILKFNMWVTTMNHYEKKVLGVTFPYHNILKWLTTYLNHYNSKWLITLKHQRNSKNYNGKIVPIHEHSEENYNMNFNISLKPYFRLFENYVN